MGEYKDFKDCVSKNKDKKDPNAYCGYIKHQIEGGKKEEEVCMECEEHEAYHLEEGIRKLEDRRWVCSDCGAEIGDSTEDFKKHSAICPSTQFKEKVADQPKQKREEALKEAQAFLTTLRATIDEVTLMAKDAGYFDVSEKVSPTQPTYLFQTGREMADVVVKQAKGFGVQVNWFNATLDELRDIVNSANKFFIDAGWNSKETVKEYEAHKKKWGKDWM